VWCAGKMLPPTVARTPIQAAGIPAAPIAPPPGMVSPRKTARLKQVLSRLSTSSLSTPLQMLREDQYLYRDYSHNWQVRFACISHTGRWYGKVRRRPKQSCRLAQISITADFAKTASQLSPTSMLLLGTGLGFPVPSATEHCP
jgi:hypothetical protein